MLHHKLYTGALVILLALVALLVGEGIKRPSIISEETAVSLALSYAKDDGHVGGFTVQPTRIYGKTMTYGEAVQYVFARPINPNEAITKMRDKPVWVIVFDGEFIEHVPPAPGIPARDVLHNQMVVILDGSTGDILEEILVSPKTKLSVSSLPVLIPSSGSASPVPIERATSTVIPLPTATPVR